MKSMQWLIRREFWENKGMFFWAPLVVGAILVAFIGFTTLYFGVQYQQVANVGEEERAAIVHMMASAYMTSSVPIFLMMTVIVFFYALSALYDDRRDRSILFWKSLPISDRATVISKVVAALVVAPLICSVVAIATSLLLLVFVCISLAINGVHIVAALISDPALYLAPLAVLGLLPVYFLWALPTVGWLLLVSSWARSKVFLWAVGSPLLALVVVKWATYEFQTGWNVDWLAEHIVARGLAGVVPGIWLVFAHVAGGGMVIHSEHKAALDLTEVFGRSWGTLATPDVWIGAAVGVALIVGAVRLRRWRDEG
jgi:ABC-2 type transport system permease protein